MEENLVGYLLGTLSERERQQVEGYLHDRPEARPRVACANNLRVLWVGLQAYSDRGNGDFPRVEPEGPRGIGGVFMPILNDAGALGDVNVTCPAQGPAAPPPRTTVAELEGLYRSDP